MGQKYAIFDEQGFPKAFYDEDIHEDKIPQEAISITDEQWYEFINNQGRRRWDFEKKEVVEYIPPPPSLDEVKQQKLHQLKQELQNFIYSHYDQGTQASLTAIYQQAKEGNKTEVITQITKVWDWIRNVLIYYYTKKNEIINATTITELNNVIWNWQDVEETEHIELKDVMQLLNQ